MEVSNRLYGAGIVEHFAAWIIMELIYQILPVVAASLLSSITTFIAVVWKLGNRVTALESELKALQDDVQQITKSHEKFQTDIVARLEEIHKNIDVSFDRIHTEMAAVTGKIKEDQTKFSVTCAENRSKVVSTSTFSKFAEKEQERWDKLHQLVGKLEGVVQKMAVISRSGSMRAVDPMMR